MTIHSTPLLQPFVPAALAASRVGTWEYDVTADRVRCDATTAALFGLKPDEADGGVPVEQARAAIHPEDRPRAVAEFERAIHHGGLFVIEYRTQPRAEDVRWVLIRGCYATDASGRVMIGRGIILDVTESKQDGYAEGRAHFQSADTSADADDPLDHVADLALRTRRAIDRLGGLTGALLRPAVDALLRTIGRQIAARLSRTDDGDNGPETQH